MTNFQDNPAQAIHEFIFKTVMESPKNRLTYLDNCQAVEEPLVGFGDGYDPVISQFKKVIVDFHMNPQELWQQAFPGPLPQHLTLVCWILPFTETIRASNRKRKEAPSKHWLHNYYHSEMLDNQLRTGLVAFLKEHGCRAVAGARPPLFKRLLDYPAGPVSNWSERHYCYVAGLGTFGLSRGLITRKGMAIRCASVLTELELPITARKYESPTAYCPFLEMGGCGLCMKRCPAGAITAGGKDNIKCLRYIKDVLMPLCKGEVPPEVINDPVNGGHVGQGCGLCQTGVPCESRVPEERYFKTKRK